VTRIADPHDKETRTLTSNMRVHSSAGGSLSHLLPASLESGFLHLETTIV